MAIKKSDVNKISNIKNTSLSGSNEKYLSWIFFTSAVFLLFYIRIRLINIPFERDEGEFGYIAQLILKGNSFLDAYNYKIPGVSFVYALFIAIFGSTTQAVKLSLLTINIITLVYFYHLVKNIFNRLIASISALFLVFLITDSAVLGNAAHATQYLNAGFIASLFYIYKAIKKNTSKYFFLSGLSMGFALIMKQNALALFPLPLLIFLSSNKIKTFISNWKNYLYKFFIYSISFSLPIGCIFLISFLNGELSKLWDWIYVYPKNYASVLSVKDGYQLFKINFSIITSNYLFLWLFAALGFIITLFWKKDKFNLKIQLLLIAVISFISIVPGFYFRNHYFVIILPSVALFSSLFFFQLKSFFSKKLKENTSNIIIAIFVFIISISFLSTNKDYFFNKTPLQLSRIIYGTNPFIEGYHIGKYIKENSNDTDKVAVLGSEAEIYFYSQRKAATGFLFTYDMVNLNPYNLAMQLQMINEIEKNKPLYLVFANTATSWLVQPGSPDTLFKWFNHYIKDYDLICIADIFSNITYYKWFKDAQTYKPQSQSYMLLFRKKSFINSKV